MNFSNYNLVSISKENIIEFCKKLYKQNKSLLESQPKNNRNYNPINIAVNNLYYMFNPNDIEYHVNRYNINYIPSYRIDTVEEISLIILNPTNSGLTLLKELHLERESRLNLILNELLIHREIYIDLNKIQSRFNIMEHEITEVHLCYYILDLIKSKKLKLKYSNITAIYENILKEFYEEIPLRKYSYDHIVTTLFSETLILANPEENFNLISTPELNGILLKPNLKEAYLNEAKKHCKEILPGTGELI